MLTRSTEKKSQFWLNYHRSTQKKTVFGKITTIFGQIRNSKGEKLGVELRETNKRKKKRQWPVEKDDGWESLYVWDFEIRNRELIFPLVSWPCRCCWYRRWKLRSLVCVFWSRKKIKGYLEEKKNNYRMDWNCYSTPSWVEYQFHQMGELVFPIERHFFLKKKFCSSQPNTRIKPFWNLFFCPFHSITFNQTALRDEGIHFNKR